MNMCWVYRPHQQITQTSICLTAEGFKTSTWGSTMVDLKVGHFVLRVLMMDDSFLCK